MPDSQPKKTNKAKQASTLIAPTRAGGILLFAPAIPEDKISRCDEERNGYMETGGFGSAGLLPPTRTYIYI